MKGLIATTYNWRAIAGDGRYSQDKNPYASVYAGVIAKRLSRGWRLEQVRTAEHRVSSMYRQETIAEEASVLHNRLVFLEPHLVFHDPNNFDLQNRTLARRNSPNTNPSMLNRRMDQIMRDSHEAIFRSTKGKVERVHSLSGRWQDEISHKDAFSKVAPSIGVPTPKTKILSDLSPLKSPFKTGELRRELTGSSRGDIIIKAVHSSGGKDVFPLRNNRDAINIFQDNDTKPTNYVAQALLPLPADLPYSIRTVTWGGMVLGAALLMNPTSKVVSNSHHGGAIPFDLGLPGKAPRCNGMSQLEQVWHSDRRKFFDTAEYCGIDLTRRELPESIYSLSKVIGGYPSNALLRGNDFMFDSRGNPVAIESNSHPGPPGTAMWNVIHGDTASGESLEINIATRLIVQAILDQSKK